MNWVLRTAFDWVPSSKNLICATQYCYAFMFSPGIKSSFLYFVFIFNIPITSSNPITLISKVCPFLDALLSNRINRAS